MRNIFTLSLTVVFALTFFASLCSGELPEQFSIWGKKAASHIYLRTADPDSIGFSDIQVSAAETTAGSVLLEKAACDASRHNDMGKTLKRCTILNARDCPEQYGPFIFSLAALRSAEGGIGSVRAMYGFFCWKVKAEGVSQWVYYHNATPSGNYTWPAEDGVSANIPSLRWEMIREGAKDRRYLATLEAKIDNRTDQNAEEARKFLKEIEEKVEIRTDTYDHIGGGRIAVEPVGTYDRWRERIIDLIIRL